LRRVEQADPQPDPQYPIPAWRLETWAGPIHMRNRTPGTAFRGNNAANRPIFAADGLAPLCAAGTYCLP
jgi:hypothetical protein